GLYSVLFHAQTFRHRKYCLFVSNGRGDLQFENEGALPRLASQDHRKVGGHPESLIFQQGGIEFLSLQGRRVDEEGPAQKMRGAADHAVTDVGKQGRDEGSCETGAEVLGEVPASIDRENADLVAVSRRIAIPANMRKLGLRQIQRAGAAAREGRGVACLYPR